MTDTPKLYTADEITGLVNDAANDIDEFVELPDEGARDALNLLVNIVATRAANPGKEITVVQIIETCYDDTTTPDDVASWIGSR